MPDLACPVLDTTAPVMRSRVTEWIRACRELVPMLEREGWVRFDQPEDRRDEGMIVLRREVPYV